MVRDIKIYPDKILKQKTRLVERIDEATQKLIDDMIETLYANKGAGLAANQVGEGKRITVVDAGDGVRVLINPEILSRQGKIISNEGCLSFPGIELKIKRPTEIEVNYLNQRGEAKKNKASDLLARIICHEIDHLDGKTMLNRVGLWQNVKTRYKLLRRKQA